MTTTIETDVPGSPGSVRECARWLRAAPAGDLDDAGDRQADARRGSGEGWLGEAGEAYRGAAGGALRATDDHAARTRRAAGALDEVADRMAGLERSMHDLRDEARAGGLVVAGTRISMPVDLSIGPASPLTAAADDARPVFARIAGAVADARAEHRAWVEDRLARAQTDAEDRGDLDRVLGRLEAGASASASATPVAAATGQPGGGPGAASLAGAPSPRGADRGGPVPEPSRGGPGEVVRSGPYLLPPPGRRLVVSSHPLPPPRSYAVTDEPRRTAPSGSRSAHDRPDFAVRPAAPVGPCA